MGKGDTGLAILVCCVFARIQVENKALNLDEDEAPVVLTGATMKKHCFTRAKGEGRRRALADTRVA